MNIKINRAGLVLMVFLIALPASAGELVPFRAVLDTEPVPVGSCGPGCIELDITGVGQATHMGRTEIQGPSEVDVILGEQTGTSTLTAANGDTLVIEFAGTVVFEGPDPIRSASKARGKSSTERDVLPMSPGRAPIVAPRRVRSAACCWSAV